MSKEKIYINALFIGPMKTATTWIYEYLSLRDDIDMPRGVKETFFFSENYDKGLSWYLEHFNNINRGKIGVEVAPSYFHSKMAPARVKKSLGPDIQIITTLREPVSRSYSHYLHLKRYGFTTKNLSAAISDYPEIIEASKYEYQIERWQSYFGRDIKILMLDELKKSPEDFVKRLCGYLDMPISEIPEDLKKSKSNVSTQPYSITLASWGQKVADYLREKRLYGPIAMAKSIGLKKIFFGMPSSSKTQTINDVEKKFLQKELKKEIIYYEKLRS